jgi:glutamate racemase
LPAASLIMPTTPESTDPIGVFDSGLGGLTVVKQIIQFLPNEKIVYFGDTARVPYGTKSADTIIRYSRQIVDALLKHKVKMIVAACNTASALALDVLAKECKVPLVGVITPGARKAAHSTKSGKIGIIATSSTVKSGAYADRIRAVNPKAEVTSAACPLFVPLVEEGWFEHKVTYDVAQQYLAPMKKARVDTLILGCTHYPLLKNVIHSVMGPKVSLVDSAEEVAAQVRQMLLEKNLLRMQLSPAGHVFLVSDEPENFKRLASRFLGGGVQDVRKYDV